MENERLEVSLARNARPEAAEWSRVRASFAARAAALRLIDVAFERHDSPLGRILLGATAEGVVRVGLPVEDEERFLEELALRISPRVLRAERAALKRARSQLDQYFAGRRRAFDLPLDWRLCAGFRRDVLRATARIPYGATASYKEIAARAGSPAAARAAGTALATNPLPILVPCHRVLPSSGALGRYGGGVEAKAHLLALERGS